MKYTTEIEINLSRDEMVRLLDDPQNMKHWQRGLLSYELLSGEAGTEGAQMELQYKMGNRHMTMVETIIKRDFPAEFHATYDTKGVHNIQKNYFKELDAHRCMWVSESEFQFSSLPLKLMGWLMPGAFRKQSMKYLSDFKRFAEEGVSVAGS